MPFRLPEGHKFGCVCIVNAGVDRTLMGRLLDLGNNVCAIFGPPFEIEEHWREWLGSVKVENLAHTSLALLASTQSNRPEILDGENKALVETAAGVFHGLLMTDVFHHDSVLVLSGARGRHSSSERPSASHQTKRCPCKYDYCDDTVLSLGCSGDAPMPLSGTDPLWECRCPKHACG